MNYIRSISSNRGKPNLKNRTRKIELGAIPDNVVISEYSKDRHEMQDWTFFKNRKELHDREQRNDWG